MGIIEYIYWMGLQHPPQPLVRSYLFIVVTVLMFWYIYTKLPRI